MMQIYLITNQVNGKIYVGQTRQEIAKYFYNQGWRARQDVCKKPALYSSIRKHGIENFSVRCLRKCQSVQEMNDWEKIYISLFCSRDKEIGYNIASGGEGAPGREPWNKGKKSPYSAETLLKMSVSQKQRIARDGSPNKGVRRSDEQKRKISDTLKARGFRPSVEACRLGGRVRQGTA